MSAFAPWIQLRAAPATTRPLQDSQDTFVDRRVAPRGMEAGVRGRLRVRGGFAEQVSFLLGCTGDPLR
ncbi:hypothetical protein NDU88_001471 [Pleurodeles waltl]|uniref:Uncharacterized protein n=1 Tax=Pleurodeles waltl TaxID=8319 RepID=A0AAV7MJT8_PLEWA|nr:hypothetical protein NDU88_001471 [Pleurodeles waltl]